MPSHSCSLQRKDTTMTVRCAIVLSLWLVCSPSVVWAAGSIVEVGSAAGSQGPTTWVVGYEVRMNTPTAITSLDRTFTFVDTVQTETIQLSYTCHEWAAGRGCGLVLVSIHDGTRFLVTPLILYGNVGHAVQAFTIPLRAIDHITVNIQAVGYGQFEIQMLGMGR
mgnify:CR=1 FL=1